MKPEAQQAKTNSIITADAVPGSSTQKDSANKKSRSGEHATAAVKRVVSTNGNGSVSSGRDSRPPIVIVPSALSGIISSMNAADFLENSTYVTIEEKRKNGAPREKEKFITRIVSGDIRSKYLLVDNAKLSPKDWDRVVAVFATGQAWQFKDWPQGYSNPVELFSKVRNIWI